MPEKEIVEIPVELYTRASEELEKEVEEDLKVVNGQEEKSIATIIKQHGCKNCDCK